MKEAEGRRAREAKKRTGTCGGESSGVSVGTEVTRRLNRKKQPRGLTRLLSAKIKLLVVGKVKWPVAGLSTGPPTSEMRHSFFFLGAPCFCWR